MRILLISNGYPPHRWAGTETYTAGIAGGLLGRGHAVRVLCTGRWDEGDEYWNGYDDDSSGGVPVRRLHLNWAKAPDPFRYLFDNPVVAGYLERYLDEWRPDVIQTTSCETLSASVLRVARKRAVPSVVRLTDFWFICPRISLIRGDGGLCDGRTTALECLRCMMSGARAYRWPNRVLPKSVVSALLMLVSRSPGLARQRGLRGYAGDTARRKAYLHEALGWPDALITASAFVRDIYRANGVVAPLSVQPYGHDLGWLDRYGGKTPSETLRVGFIGQISEVKGAHLLLQAYRLVCERFPGKVSLLIYGNVQDGHPYSETLRSLASGLPAACFCGTYPHGETARVFADIDVLVVPSTWYDFPLIIHEAFATKTPVVATDLGGMAESVADGTNGLLFDRGDVAGLARAIERMIAEPGLRERLKNGIAPVKRIEAEVAELEALYEGLTAKLVHMVDRFSASGPLTFQRRRAYE